MEVAKSKQSESVTIPAPNFKVAVFTLRGDSPLVMNKFSDKTRIQMKEQQEKGSTGRKGKKREPKDFEALYKQAIHYNRTGDWMGIPAIAIRAAMVSACKIVGFHMTKGKLALFVLADGFGSDGTPLVRITKGEPFMHEAMVRNATGVADIRPRPMWDPGWEAVLRIRFDADMFTLTDVSNLLMRAGIQVGILEGRPDSPKSVGQGWGTFDILEEGE